MASSSKRPQRERYTAEQAAGLILNFNSNSESDIDIEVGGILSEEEELDCQLLVESDEQGESR